MEPLYPLTFDLTQLIQDYLWGGSKLKSLVPDYPIDQPLAELWLVSDRTEDERVGTITNGPFAGTTLRELMETQPTDLLGNVASVDGKFPLLIKFLDAKERLSLQVHPPESKAKKLGGDPKTECWTFLDGTESSANLFAGVRSGVTRDQFEQTLKSGGDLEPLLHTMHPKTGDCLFLPSGRLHGLGAGSLVYEVQQNSNTTYRVFDRNRVDKRTGQPRELHVDKALASIDFADVEPEFQKPERREEHGATIETLIDCQYFTLERWTTTNEQTITPNRSFEIITVIDGELSLEGNGETLQLQKFGTTLVPAAMSHYTTSPKSRSDASRHRSHHSVPGTEDEDRRFAGEWTGNATFLRTFVRTRSMNAARSPSLPE